MMMIIIVIKSGIFCMLGEKHEGNWIVVLASERPEIKARSAAALHISSKRLQKVSIKNHFPLISHVAH